MMKIVGDRLPRYLKIIEPCEILVRYLLIFNTKLSSLYPFASKVKFLLVSPTLKRFLRVIIT